MKIWWTELFPLPPPPPPLPPPPPPPQIESLGKFKIQHEVVGGQEVVFRFHPKSKLQGGHSVTVKEEEIERGGGEGRGGKGRDGLS